MMKTYRSTNTEQLGGLSPKKLTRKSQAVSVPNEAYQKGAPSLTPFKSIVYSF